MPLLKFEEFVNEGFFFKDKFVYHAKYSSGEIYEFTADNDEAAQKIADSLSDSPCMIKKIGPNSAKSNGFKTFIHGGKSIHAF